MVTELAVIVSINPYLSTLMNDNDILKCHQHTNSVTNILNLKLLNPEAYDNILGIRKYLSLGTVTVKGSK